MKIGILTCESIPNLNPDDQQIIPRLNALRFDTSAVVWNDSNIDWTAFDVLIFRNTWDYFEKQQEFDQWLQKIQDLGIKTLNDIGVIQENKHKFYLKKLEKEGIKIIPTIFLNKTENLDLKSVVPKHWQKIILKPAYSGASFQTTLFDPTDIEKINDDYRSINAQKELLLQEYMPEIETNGETSFIFFNKQYSHCINKKPVANDFRVQSQFGGVYQEIFPDSELIAKAKNIVDKIVGDLLYARIDAIVISNELHLMEVECIEPDLYFKYSKNSFENFFTALVNMLNQF